MESHVCKMAQARDAATARWDSRPRKVGALESRVRNLGDKLDLFKRRESTRCNT